MIGQEFDVTKNIKMTEDLQCQLLASVSELFCAINDQKTKAEKADILARTEILLYLMAGRMGISKEMLDHKAVSQIRVGLLEEDKAEWKPSLLQLLHQLDNG